jgi:hypothetical protein
VCLHSLINFMVRNLPVGISSEDHRGHNPGKTVEFISFIFYQNLGISSADMVLDGFYFLLVFLLYMTGVRALKIDPSYKRRS